MTKARFVKRLDFCIFSFALLGIMSCVLSSPGRASTYIVQDHVVIDLRNGLEWLRCSVGQDFIEGDCVGDALRLNHEEIKQAIKIANKDLGGLWRLPNRKELAMLVCKDCPPPKIDLRAFPNTQKEPYWTSQRNWLAPKHYWSVSFMTGHNYARFFGYQKLAVRLVRTRTPSSRTKAFGDFMGKILKGVTDGGG